VTGIGIGIGLPFGIGGIDPFFANTVLLANFNGADEATSYSDESNAKHGAFTFVGGAELDTAQSQFGVSSLLLPGSSDWLTLPDHDDWTPGLDQPFTIEAWIRPDVSSAASDGILSHGVATTEESWTLSYESINGRGEFDWMDTVPDAHALSSSPAAIPEGGVFTHVAATRDGDGDVTLWIAGALANGPINETLAFLATTGLLYVGSSFGGASAEFFGHIDSVRITMDVARYTDTFTPEEFPTS